MKKGGLLVVLEFSINEGSVSVSFLLRRKTDDVSESSFFCCLSLNVHVEISVFDKSTPQDCTKTRLY